MYFFTLLSIIFGHYCHRQANTVQKVKKKFGYIYCVIYAIYVTNKTKIYSRVSLCKSSPVTGLEWPRVLQEVKVPRFQKKRYRIMVRLSALSTGRFTPRKYTWYSFLLEAEWTSRP
jgi:hypothetical protein